jgi:hypothetical protein
MAAENGNRAAGERQVHNEALFREVNEHIERVGKEAGFGSDGQLDFTCECVVEDCIATLSLSVDEYEAVRIDATHFFLRPGHENLDVERVVDRNDRYVVVEKFGEAGAAAIKLDPRARRARLS